MPHSPTKLSQFLQELKRRKVVRVITVYAAAAFVILELVSIIAEPLKLPDWTLAMVIVLLCIGFIIAVILSWIYDVTPQGIERTKSVKETGKRAREKPSSLMAWKIATYLSAIVIVVLAVMHFVNRSEQSKDVLELDKSVAVLPFENMSDDSEFAHLGDAFTDEIIMQLYKISEFEVRSRTSIMQYKKTEKSSPEISEELNVSYLLEGSTQRYEDRVRIRVQLIQASTDDHIWGDVYEGEWIDIFDIQIDVAKQVAHELKTVLSADEIERIENKSTENIEAYNLYLQGRHFYHQKGKENLDKSLECFKRALEIDKNYALAYSGMAATYTAFATNGYFQRKAVIPEAKEASIKALEIDPKLGEAHSELAWAMVINDWEWIEGEHGFKRALELNPNYESAHSQYAWLLSMVGRHEEAIKENKRAHELDPLSIDIWVGLGRRYYFAREYDRAIAEYHKVLEMFPNSDYARSHLALALSQKGLHDEAIEEFLKIETVTHWYWYLGYIYGAAGEKEKALEILNYYLELSKSEFVWLSNFTFMYAGMGETDKAMEWLEKTYEQREAWMDLLQVEPMYDNLRSDPRFQEILDLMNYPD